MIDVVYFAWVRERIGIPKEALDTSAATVSELLDELRQKEDRYAVAFEDVSALRFAIDQQLGDLDSSIEGAREVAIFPPMTGG